MDSPPDPPPDPLLNPVWEALSGPQAGLALRRGAAARFPPEMAPFAGVGDPSDPAAWRDLAELSRDDAVAVMESSTPPGWRTLSVLEAVRFVAPAKVFGAVPTLGAEVVRLGPDDGPEMLDLAERTDPGPFRARTLELGGFVGVRRDGRLVAMAGQRIQPPGWSEITAVCTDPSVRGQGLGATVVRAVIADIAASDRRAFLHVMRANTVAIGLYERLGFTPHEELQVRVVRPPRV